MSLTYRLDTKIVVAALALAACELKTSEDSATTGPTTTDPATTGGELADCETTDPTVSAAFDVQTHDWPEGDALALGVLCTVDAVTPAADTVSTALTCDVDGVDRPATVVIAAAPEGPVVWDAGDDVRLRYQDFVFETGPARRLQLRDPADDSLLMYAADSVDDEGISLTPLTFRIDTLCNTSGEENELPTRLRFGLPDGEVEVGVVSGHRGALPIDAADHYIIDVAESRGTPIHLDLRLHFLLRRVHVEA